MSQYSKRFAKDIGLFANDNITLPELGLRLTNGMRGTAIVEGAVNSLIKVSPDGKLLGVMVDEHDFMKVPTKNRVVAATMPMQGSIFESRKKMTGGQPVEKFDDKLPKTEKTMKVDDVVDIKPSEEAIRRELLWGANDLTGATSLLYGGFSDDENIEELFP